MVYDFLCTIDFQYFLLGLDLSKSNYNTVKRPNC